MLASWCCCFLLSLLFAGFVVECGAEVTRHCRRRLRHISPDQGPRLMCECKMKQVPWGRAVLITKFEVDSSYNCVLRTLCPNAPIVTPDRQGWYNITIKLINLGKNVSFV